MALTRPLKAERLFRMAFESQNLDPLYNFLTVHLLIHAVRLMATLGHCHEEHSYENPQGVALGSNWKHGG